MPPTTVPSILIPMGRTRAQGYQSATIGRIPNAFVVYATTLDGEQVEIARYYYQSDKARAKRHAKWDAVSTLAALKRTQGLGESTMKTLFTDKERQELQEVAKYRPPDPDKFTLRLSNRAGKQVKDRQYKTLKAAETALKKAIKRDIVHKALWKARILPPGTENYLHAVATYSLQGKGDNAVWYKDTPGGSMTMFKIYS